MGSLIYTALLLFAIGALHPEGFGQAVENDPKRISNDKPSVFLTFDRRVRAFEQCTRCEQDSFRLRLSNNLTRPINVDATYGASDPLKKIKGRNGRVHDALPDGSIVALCYQPESMISMVSKIDGGSLHSEIPVFVDLPRISLPCSCRNQESPTRPFDSSGLWIAPGGYVYFDVPVEFLSKGLKIYTLFNYEWEFRDGRLGPNEPGHKVYFYSTDIRR